MPEERPFLPVQDRSDEYRLDHIADAIDAAVDDPNERAVMRNIAVNLLIDHQPETVGDALDILGASSNEARRAYYDRARTEAGLPTLREEAVEESLRNPPTTTEPPRDANGEIDAFCPGCGASEAGGPGSQFRKVNVVRWYCADCLRDNPSLEEFMRPWQPPQYRLSPSGGLVDIQAEDIERRIAEREAEARRANREREQAARAADTESLREFEEHRNELDRLSLRQQFPWGVEAA